MKILLSRTFRVGFEFPLLLPSTTCINQPASTNLHQPTCINNLHQPTCINNLHQQPASTCINITNKHT
jgi:hypothetical protein